MRYGTLRTLARTILRLLLHPEFLRFLLFGGIATLVSFFSGFLLYAFGDIPYAMAVFIGSAAAIVVNFALNYAYNFHYLGRSMASQFITFAAVAIVGTVLTTLLAKGMLHAGLWLLPTWPLLDMEVVCHVLAIGIVTIYSFFAHKYLSFNAGILVPLRRIVVRIRRTRRRQRHRQRLQRDAREG